MFSLAKLARAGFTAFLLCTTLCMTGCGAGIYTDTSVSVAPQANEDLAGSCRYEMQLPEGDTNKAGTPIAGVFVVFDRSNIDTRVVFDNPDVRSAASAGHVAMVYAYQCNAKSFPDLQPQAAQGPGRALFTALDEFATKLNKPELSTAKVVLYGFSASAYLSATMMNYAPDRIAGLILYAPAAATANLDGLELPTGAAKIPAMILANAQDNLAGTTRPMNLYRRGIAAGAPWAFAVTNGVGHCCNFTTVELDAAFLAALYPPSPDNGPTPQVSAQAAESNFICSFDGTWDVVGLPNCSITKAAIGAPAPNTRENISWLPDANTAQKWLAFVNKIW